MSRSLGVLLGLSALNLAAMVPGGLVETRQFPDYPVIVLAGFNLFLTALGFGSLALAVAALRGRPAPRLAIGVAIAYLAVYGADLAQVFPVSEVPMSALLAGMEAFGCALACGVLWAALRLDRGPENTTSLRISPPAALFVTGVAIVIIVFATYSAMQP